MKNKQDIRTENNTYSLTFKKKSKKWINMFNIYQW